MGSGTDDFCLKIRGKEHTLIYSRMHCNRRTVLETVEIFSDDVGPGFSLTVVNGDPSVFHYNGSDDNHITELGAGELLAMQNFMGTLREKAAAHFAAHKTIA